MTFEARVQFVKVKERIPAGGHPLSRRCEGFLWVIECSHCQCPIEDTGSHNIPEQGCFAGARWAIHGDYSLPAGKLRSYEVDGNLLQGDQRTPMMSRPSSGRGQGGRDGLFKDTVVVEKIKRLGRFLDAQIAPQSVRSSILSDKSRPAREIV